jgi:hypothetical protein
MFRAGHANLAAERADFIRDAAVIGGHHRPLHEPGPAGPPVDMLDNGMSQQFGERLARKSRRAPSRRNNGKNASLIIAHEYRNLA